MGTETAIQWTHHTFNAWRGCEKVSPGCDNCYAEAMSLRNPEVLGYWGRGRPRPQASESYWRHPVKWSREAEAAGERRRVFCSSLSDVFEDREDLDASRSRLLETIEKTPHLDWLLLTKRPENWRKCLERLAAVGVSDGDCLAEKWLDGEPLPNIWLGVSVEDQKRADERIPALLEIPAVRFLSMEPLLDRVDLSAWLGDYWCNRCKKHSFDCAANTHCSNCGHEGSWDDNDEPCPKCGEFGETEMICPRCGIDGGNGGLDHNECWERETAIDWVIVGGESGPDARPCDLAWIRSVRDQCKAAGVPVFVKQLGSRPFDSNGADGFPAAHEVVTSENMHSPATLASLAITLELMSVPLGDKKGGNPNEWPEDLRIREFPIPKGTA